MLEYGLPVLFTLFLWWFATGLILHLDGLRPETFRWSMAGATVLLVAALAGLGATAADTTVAGAYAAFTCALLAWGWVELGFLTGWVTGPRRTALPAGTVGWDRLRAAVEAILWHELAIVAIAAAILALTWGAPNEVGAWTFLVLWAMRTSAKFNVFLGVRNLGEEFLPGHLRYLSSYFARRPMNALFPVSVTLSTVACALILDAALAPGTDAFEAAGLTLVGTLLALAVIEHWFLVLPVRIEALWQWGLRSRGAAGRRRVSAWGSQASGPCDPGTLRALLDAVAAGAFGQVESMRGVVRARSGWIRFDLADGRSRLHDAPVRGEEELRVVAVGRAVDEARLRAALEACAMRAAA